MTLQLYTYDGAPNPRRVNLFLGYKGIQIPSRQINLREGEQFSPQYAALNPRCTVPALQLDDGTVLCDAIAICWYLESRHPQPPLLGIEPLSQAQILSWDAYIFSDAFLPVAEALRNRSQAFKDRAVTGPGRVAQIPELEARGRQRVQLFWEYLDQYLDGRDYLVGHGVTMADIDAFVVIDFAGWIKERVPESRSRVQAWYRRIKGLLPAS
jgi:glutathione S-transferase